MRWVTCEGERATDYTTRVKDFVRSGLEQEPDSGLYAYYCGASHSEVWRLQFGYVEQDNNDGTVTFQRRTAAATVNMAVGVCIDSLWYGAKRAYEYIDDGAGRTELLQRVVSLRAACRME